ncbi:hypothetical protein [Shimia sediminis]|uniref:hypothetical protein n=1 Tax=Shimia sediminis TaxID=2497945 RepID=UPI000F8E98FD|nr:hypothetical protein [Shimia sediminis]
MRSLTRRIKHFWGNKFGRCAVCMRFAFWGAVLGGLTTFLAVKYDFGLVLVSVLAILSMVLATTTLAHVVTFAVRHVWQMRRAAAGELVQIGPHAVLPIRTGRPEQQVSRRQLLGLVFKYGALASAVTLGLPTKSRAACGDCAAHYGAGHYDCITYFCNDQGHTCCPPGFPYLNHCDCICYDGNGFDCNSYSNCLYCG